MMRGKAVQLIGDAAMVIIAAITFAVIALGCMVTLFVFFILLPVKLIKFAWFW